MIKSYAKGKFPLHAALATKNNFEATLLIKHIPESVLSKDPDGKLPLHVAAAADNNVEVLRLLLEKHSAGARASTKDGWLPLHFAAGQNTNEEVVRELLNAYPGALLAVTDQGMTPLHLAASHNSNVNVVRLLLDSHPESINFVDIHGSLPLHAAAGNSGNVNVVRLLLTRRRENAMVPNKYGCLPLHTAAKDNRNVDVVQLLLENHPDKTMITVKAKDGCLPIHLAAKCNTNVEVVRVLGNSYPDGHHVATKSGHLPLHLAARSNTNVDIVRYLLQAHPDSVKSLDGEGCLPLHLAAQYNTNVDVVRELLRTFPESVMIRTSDGQLPLHKAAASTSNHVDVVRLLLETYAEGLMVHDSHGRSPLHIAAKYNHNVEVVRRLLWRHPEGVMALDADGCLPLHIVARYNGNVEVVDLFLKTYPEGLIVANHHGYLPLHEAARYNSNVDVVRLLLIRNVDVGVRVMTSDGWLPLHLAARYNSNAEVARWLMLEYGGALFEQSMSLRLPIVYARMNEKCTTRLLRDMSLAMVEYALANPRHTNTLREVFGDSDYVGLFNFQKGFGGVVQCTRPVVTVHICGEKLAGKTTLTSWLQQKLKQRSTLLGRASTVFNRPQMAVLIDFDERTPGLLVHTVDSPHDVQYVIHDYGGHMEFRKVYRPFLNVPQSLYVVVLPLVEKLSDKEHRAYSIEALVSQYQQWLGQIHNAIQGELPSSPTVLTVLNDFTGQVPATEMPHRKELRKHLQACQAIPALKAVFHFSPCMTIDCRNEHDCSKVCADIETWAHQQLTNTHVDFTTNAIETVPVVEDLRNSFDCHPIASPFVQESEYHLDVRRRLLDCGYREEDEISRSLDLLVKWWMANSQRTRRIMRLSRGPGKEAIIVTSVEALSHLLFGKVLDNMRRRSAVVIRRDAVRDIVLETINMGLEIDAADLLSDVGLFTRIVAYDVNSGQVDRQLSANNRSDQDLFLVIGLIDQHVGTHNMNPPEFRPETTRRIHRWYTLDQVHAMDWGPDFFVALFHCILSLVPSCVGPRIYKDGIYAMVEDGQRRTTYIVRPHRHESHGDGLEVIVDISTEDVTALTFQDIVRQDDVVWMGLQKINATCRRLIGEKGLHEYCVYPDPRSTLSARWVVDVERELKVAEAHGDVARFQLQKYLYGYFPLERVTLQHLTANLSHRLESGEVTNAQLAAGIQLLHRSLERSVVYTQSMHTQLSESIAQTTRKITELHATMESSGMVTTAGSSPRASVMAASSYSFLLNAQLSSMESTLNNLLRAQLHISRNMCDFPLLVCLQRAEVRSMGAMVSSVFNRRYRVCCMCPVCGEIAQPVGYVLQVSRGAWSRYLLRAMQASVVLIGVALKSAGVPTMVADAMYTATTTLVNDVSKELGTLVEGFRKDVTARMVAHMNGTGESVAKALISATTSNTAAKAVVQTVTGMPGSSDDRERWVSWEYIRAMKALFEDALKDPGAEGSGLVRVWSDDGDVAFVCRNVSRGCRERFRQEGRKCLRVVVLYAG